MEGLTCNHYTPVRIYVSRHYNILYYMFHTHAVLPLHLLYLLSHGNDVLRHHKVG